MAQRSSLSGRSPFCQLIRVKKGSSKMRMDSTSSAFKQQKLEETRDKPWERKVRSPLAQAFGSSRLCSRPCGLGKVGKVTKPHAVVGCWVVLTSFVISRCSVITKV